jgi:hypothetical protein
MYDVVVYMSSLPRISDRNRKIEVLQAFAAGAASQGARVLIQKEYTVVDCKLAVILGWVGTKIAGPHISLRQSVIDTQKRLGRYVMPIDSSCFKFTDHNSQFLRYSLNGVFYNKDNYANKNSSSQKWQHISQTLNLSLRPWRTHGNHILVCLQRDGGWSLKGTDLNQWTAQTVQKLRQLTNHPIVIRPHPKTKVDLSNLTALPRVTQSDTNKSLDQDLDQAWAAVFYNSSSSVAAALHGIPIFAHDDDCVAWAIANKTLDSIGNPVMPDRTQWLYDLAAAHWSDQEVLNGEIYKKFLPLII